MLAMTPAEIIIQHPKLNTNRYRQFSFSANHKDHVDWLLQKEQITHNTHPYALDLCAGNLSGSWIFSQLLWPIQDITAIDIATPNLPIIRGVRMLYVDVNAFGKTLHYKNQDIPSKLLPLKHHFNIILSSYAEAEPRLVTYVVDYFLKPKGKYISM